MTWWRVDPIIKKNLKKMFERGPDSMWYKFSNESMGGNTQPIDGRNAATMNFWFVEETGEITEFSNEVKEKQGQKKGFIVLTAEPFTLPQTKWQKFTFRHLRRQIPPRYEKHQFYGGTKKARLIMEESFEMYNELRTKLWHPLK